MKVGSSSRSSGNGRFGEKRTPHPQHKASHGALPRFARQGCRWLGGEAPERPISLRSAYSLYGLIVGNVGTRAEPLVPGSGNFETGRRNGKS